MSIKAKLPDYAHRFLDSHTGSIIAEDDEAVVVQIRLTRRAIADNHRFLYDLSNAAAGEVGTAPPARLAHALARRSPLRWMMALIGVAASIVVIAVNFRADAKEEPIELASATLLTPQVVAGGELLQLIVERRQRDCSVQIESVFIRKADDVVVFRERVPGAKYGTSAEPVSFKTATHIPEFFKPGEYTYRAIIVSDCSATDGGRFVVHKPDMDFEVLPRASEVSARGRRG